MICLTGDLHHSSLGTGNQKACGESEIQVAQRFLQMLETAGVKVTFFVSGRSFVEEWPSLQGICQSPLVELGGHNFNCFTPAWPYRVWKKVARSYNGPAWVQHRDAVRTIRVIQQCTGRRIRAWRNHMYMHGPATERVLASCGIRICSDGVRRNALRPELHQDGIFNFPLNVIPDHEHIFHAERTPEWVQRWVRRYQWSDDFGSDSYSISEWTDIALANLAENERRGVVSNMIVHPITQQLADGLQSFRRILGFLAERQTVHISETIPAWPEGRLPGDGIEGRMKRQSPSLRD